MSQSASSSPSWSRRASVLLGVGCAVVLMDLGCSSDKTEVVATPACDSAKCAEGNSCIAYKGVTECRRACSSNTDPTLSCPFSYTCLSTDGSNNAFCVADDFKVLPKEKGQWGAPCNAAGGFDSNPDCDATQSFWCYGTSPSDGFAYCTQYQCTTDRDCAAGFYCGTVNRAPNVTTTNRVIGETDKACLKREYCAPCVADLDCLNVSGKPAHCVGDSAGNGFCAPECKTDEECNNEARCVDQGGYLACVPRAGNCVGDGSLCAPCRSDADCPEGACVKGTYTTERACTVKSKKACKNSSPQVASDFDCPESSAASKIVRCLGGETFKGVPKNHCHGLYTLGESADVGCWTPKR